jgi:hypothetical protein
MSYEYDLLGWTLGKMLRNVVVNVGSKREK